MSSSLEFDSLILVGLFCLCMFLWHIWNLQKFLLKVFQFYFLKSVIGWYPLPSDCFSFSLAIIQNLQKHLSLIHLTFFMALSLPVDFTPRAQPSLWELRPCQLSMGCPIALISAPQYKTIKVSTEDFAYCFLLPFIRAQLGSSQITQGGLHAVRTFGWIRFSSL